MNVIEMDTVKRGAVIAISSDDILILKNTLTELCAGVWLSDSEFATRVGFSKQKVRDIRDQMLELIDLLGIEE